MQSFEDLLEEAKDGMELNKIYNTSNMQIIWVQHHKNAKSIVVSKDGGVTWESPPSVDTGKWYYKDWLFKRVQ